MYNKELETLIDAALTDGILTTKEKQTLYKKAQALGVDLDEFEIVLNARLTKVESEERKVAEAKAPKKEFHGSLRKCPNCQATIGALDTVCPECGYEFTGSVRNESLEKLTKKIAKIRTEYGDIDKDTLQKIVTTLQAFPIPTSRSDLFEFIVAMQTGMLNAAIYKVEGDAYRAKYIEALTKAKVLFPNDPVLTQLLADEKKVLKENKSIRRKQKGGIDFGDVVAYTFGILMFAAIIYWIFF